MKPNKKEHGIKPRLMDNLAKFRKPANTTIVNVTLNTPSLPVTAPVSTPAIDPSSESEEADDSLLNPKMDDASRLNKQAKDDNNKRKLDKAIKQQDAAPLRMCIKSLAKHVDGMDVQTILDKLESLISKYDLTVSSKENDINDQVDVITGKRNM